MLAPLTKTELALRNVNYMTYLASYLAVSLILLLCISSASAYCLMLLARNICYTLAISFLSGKAITKRTEDCINMV